MEVGTLSLMAEEKQPRGEPNEQPEGAGKEPASKGPNQARQIKARLRTPPRVKTASRRPSASGPAT